MELILKKGAVENKNAIEISETVYNTFSEKSDYHIKENDKIIIIDKFFSDEKKVPDCIRYLNTPYQKMITKNQWNESSQPIPDKITSEGNIVLILESPHVDEYTDMFEPLCPANGQTGKNINKFLATILNQINIKALNSIILCNPIPWQTSLHELHKQALTGDFKKMRDAIWKHLWEQNNLPKNFIERIRSYQPEIIINACTIQLKDNVQTTINQEFKKNDRFKTNHPCSWWASKNRTIRKV